MGFEQLSRITNKYKSSYFSNLQRKTVEQNSHQSLKNIIEKRTTTGIIGSLDAVEKEFGFLWGHGKTASECSAQELEMRQKWATLRQAMLDKAHGQKRVILEELNNFTVRWNNNVRTLPVYERKVKND